MASAREIHREKAQKLLFHLLDARSRASDLEGKIEEIGFVLENYGRSLKEGVGNISADEVRFYNMIDDSRRLPDDQYSRISDYLVEYGNTLVTIKKLETEIVYLGYEHLIIERP